MIERAIVTWLVAFKQTSVGNKDGGQTKPTWLIP
jgi:hypothetical protein